MRQLFTHIDLPLQAHTVGRPMSSWASGKVIIFALRQLNDPSGRTPRPPFSESLLFRPYGTMNLSGE